MLGTDPSASDAGLARAHRHRAAGVRARPALHGARDGQPVRPLLPPDAGRRRRDHRPGRSGGQGRRADRAALGWAEAPASTWPSGSSADPDLLFLDEPTTGLDPAARREMWATIGDLRDAGTTILLTTHYMDEAQHLADRLVILAGRRRRRRGHHGRAHRRRAAAPRSSRSASTDPTVTTVASGLERHARASTTVR